MDDSYRLSTPENVELTYEPAGLGSRFMAAALDTVVLGVVLLFVLVAGVAVALSGDLFGEAGRLAVVAVLGLVVFLVFFGYYIFWEAVWHGQSPGKRAVGLRVIRDDGLPLTFSASVIRNLIRLFDLLPGSYAFGIVAMCCNRRWQRLGDIAAGTLVVRDRPPELPPELRLAVPPELAGLQLAPERRLTAREYEVVRAYMVRRQTLDTAQLDALGEELATLAERRTGVPRGRLNPGAYLGGVLALHDARAGSLPAAAPYAGDEVRGGPSRLEGQ